MIRATSLAAFALHLAAGLASAAEPELAAYVTDDDRDVFVALYDGVAVELADCSSESTARVLLGLAPTAPLREETFTGLTADFELGQHPRIPCGDEAAFDADLPATTPIWADLAGSGRYYLDAPGGEGVFYSVPIACEAIKAALAIRQRINLPGVLQAQEAPGDALALEHVLDCGSHVGGTNPQGGSSGELSRWSLHRADVFLSELSVGDSIYVAVQSRPGGGSADKTYLPIYRIDGQPAGDLIWAGGATTETTEAALFDLFGVDPEQGISPLGGDGVARLDTQVFVDLCLQDCAAYDHQHGIFAVPGFDFELTALPPPEAAVEWDLLGEERTRWGYAQGRAATFAGCSALAAALGLDASAAGETNWATALEQAIGADAAAADAFTCRGSGPDLCVRRLADGGTLSRSTFLAAADCPGASRLRVELAPTAFAPLAVALVDTGFEEIELVPADSEGRSTIAATSAPISMGLSDCLFPDVEGLLGARGLDRLTLRRIDLVRPAGGAPSEVTGIVVESGTLALDGVTLGAAGAGRVPVERGLRLCRAQTYVLGGSLESSALAVQGMSSALALIGRADGPATVVSSNFGIFLMSESQVRLHHASLRSPTALVLRGAVARGSRTAMESGSTTSIGSALRLEREARADFEQSTAAGFSCVSMFRDGTSTAQFVLPGNDLEADNANVSCGLSQVLVLE